MFCGLRWALGNEIWEYVKMREFLVEVKAFFLEGKLRKWATG